MRRRECLALLSALPLAGCLGDGADRTGTEQRPATATASARTEAATTTATMRTTASTDATGEPLALGETAETDGLLDVTVESVAVQRSVIDAHTWRELHEPADGQVLLAEMAVERDETSFGVRLDGESVAVTNVSLHGDTRQQAVAVPVRSAEQGLLVLDEGDGPAWSLPDEVLDRLESAAEFRLREAVVREGDGGTELALTVANRGDRDGTFRGIVVSAVAADADAAVRFPVPAGETVTEVVRNDVVRNWEPDADFVHDVGPDTRRFVVRHV